MTITEYESMRDRIAALEAENAHLRQALKLMASIGRAVDAGGFFPQTDGLAVQR